MIRALILLTSISLAATSQLSPQERESLRFRLENLHNEAELLVRNQRADESDLKRQDREFDALRVYDRIPYSDDVGGLKKQLTKGAEAHHLKLAQFRKQETEPPAPAIPAQVFTDDEAFRLVPEQLARELVFRVEVKGKRDDVDRWVRSWSADQLRIAEPIGDVKPGPSADEWVVDARAFAFRKIQYPKLVARDPRELLPAWARKDKKGFAQAEPQLSKLVDETRKLMPKAKPLYETKRRFLLKQAQMSFYLSKAMPKPRDPGGESRLPPGHPPISR